jgi:hypothetical protein
MRVAQKMLDASTIGGGSARAGGVVEEIKGVKYTPMPPGITKLQKTDGFPYFLAYKSPKTPFFAQRT